MTADLPPEEGVRPWVLVVDDEPAVLEVTRRLVEHLGCHADAFHDPMAALTAFTRNPSRYDAAITDVMIPGLSGPALGVQLREIRADLPIIVSTGYAEFLQTHRVPGFQPNIVLSKPVSMDELRDALHAVIPER